MTRTHRQQMRLGCIVFPLLILALAWVLIRCV
jgi:uncharacterized membrane protein YhdT